VAFAPRTRLHHLTSLWGASVRLMRWPLARTRSAHGSTPSRSQIRSVPKPLKWELCLRIGDRLPCYELLEEVRQP